MATKSTNSYTIGQVDVYFNASVNHTDLRTATFLTSTNNLGNIVSCEINPDISYIEHWISSKGKRRRDKIVENTTSLMIDLVVDELDNDNLKRFFMASDLGSNKLALFEEVLAEGAAVIRFDTDIGQDFTYYIPKCTLKPNGALSQSAEDWFSIPMTVEVLYYDTTATPWDDANYGYMDTSSIV